MKHFDITRPKRVQRPERVQRGPERAQGGQRDLEAKRSPENASKGLKRPTEAQRGSSLEGVSRGLPTKEMRNLFKIKKSTAAEGGLRESGEAEERPGEAQRGPREAWKGPNGFGGGRRGQKVLKNDRFKVSGEEGGAQLVNKEFCQMN